MEPVSSHADASPAARAGMQQFQMVSRLPGPSIQSDLNLPFDRHCGADPIWLSQMSVIFNKKWVVGPEFVPTDHEIHPDVQYM